MKKAKKRINTALMHEPKWMSDVANELYSKIMKDFDKIQLKHNNRNKINKILKIREENDNI